MTGVSDVCSSDLNSHIGHTIEDSKEVETPYRWQGVVEEKRNKVLINSGHVVAYDGVRLYDPSRFGVSELPVNYLDWEICIL